MKFLQAVTCWISCGVLVLTSSAGQAQVKAVPTDETVVLAPPPPLVLGGPVVVKERRGLFRPRARVFVVKPGPRRISVPATTTVVEPAPVRSTIVEPPAPIVEAPAAVDERPLKLEEAPAAAPELDKPNTEGEVRYLTPKVISSPRSATVIRSTPR